MLVQPFINLHISNTFLLNHLLSKTDNFSPQKMLFTKIFFNLHFTLLWTFLGCISFSQRVVVTSKSFQRRTYHEKHSISVVLHSFLNNPIHSFDHKFIEHSLMYSDILFWAHIISSICKKSCTYLSQYLCLSKSVAPSSPHPVRSGRRSW